MSRTIDSDSGIASAIAVTHCDAAWANEGQMPLRVGHRDR
jgi:hypothetical protein